jgi:hypothetical protein
MQIRRGTLSVFLLVSGIVLLAQNANRATATPIEYIFTDANVSGSLDGHAFANQTVTFSALADTSNIVYQTQAGDQIYTDVAAPATITVPSVGSDTFAVASTVVLNQTVGTIALWVLNDPIYQQNEPVDVFYGNGLSTYTLNSFIGPITALVSNGTTGPLTTQNGTFSDSGGLPTFQATAVPEPSSSAVLCLGIAAFGMRCRRRAGAA